LLHPPTIPPLIFSLGAQIARRRRIELKSGGGDGCCQGLEQQDPARYWERLLYGRGTV